MDYFLDFFFGPFCGSFWTILSGGGRRLLLREGWDAIYQYSGRGGWHTVVTEEGVEDELLVPREDWAVDVVVNAID